MKRLAACAFGVGALAMLASVPAVAQGGFGGKGGVNIANISVSDETDLPNKSSRTGIVAGIFGRIDLGPTFALQGEGLYSQQGFSAEDQGLTLTLKADYFQIPVLAKVIVPTNGGAAPNFFLGPAVSFEASCKIHGDDGQGNTAEVDCDDPSGDGFDERGKTDFGIIGGVGLDIVSGAAIFGVEVRYNLGLTNLDTSDSGESAKTRVLAILGNIAFYSPGT